MNSKNAQSNAGEDIIAKEEGASLSPMEAAESGAVKALALEAPAGKTSKLRAPGKAARVKREAEAEGEAGEDGAPQCEIFSASDILAKHLTREIDGARPFAGEWREVFLQALARAPIVSVAAKVAGVTRARALEARRAEAAFARRWDEALEEGADEIEAAAFRSAVYGEEKPVYHQGQIKGWTVEYSHAMRSMLLRARRPELFADKEERAEEGPVPMTLEEFRKRVEEARKA